MRIVTNAGVPMWRDMDIATMEKAEAVLLVPGNGAYELLNDAAEKGMPTVVLAGGDNSLAEAALELGYPEKAIIVYREGKLISLSGELNFPVVRGGMRLSDVEKVLKKALEENWTAEPVLKLGLENEEETPNMEPVVEMGLESNVLQHQESESSEPEHEISVPSEDMLGTIFGETDVYALIPIGNIDTAPIAAGLAEAMDGVRVEATFSPRGPHDSEPYLHYDGNIFHGDAQRLDNSKCVILEVKLPNLADNIALSRAKAVMLTAADYKSSQEALSYISQWHSIGASVHALLIIGDRDGNIAGTFRHRFKETIPIIRGIDSEDDITNVAREITRNRRLKVYI